MNGMKLRHIALLVLGLLLGGGAIVAQGALGQHSIAGGVTVGLVLTMLAAGVARLGVVFSPAEASRIAWALHVLGTIAGLSYPLLAKMAESVAPGTTAALWVSYALLAWGDLAKARGVMPALSSAPPGTTGPPKPA